MDTGIACLALSLVIGGSCGHRNAFLAADITEDGRTQGALKRALASERLLMIFKFFGC
jgi:hypothetical protein